MDPTITQKEEHVDTSKLDITEDDILVATRRLEFVDVKPTVIRVWAHNWTDCGLKFSK